MRAWRSAGPTARALVSGSVTGVMLSFMNRGIALGSGVVLARVLGIEQYGIYSLAIATGLILGVFVELGLPTLVLREVAQADASAGGDNGITRRSTLIMSIASLAAAVALVTGSFLHLLPGGPAARTALLMVMALVPLTALNHLLTAELMGKRRILPAQAIEFLVAPSLLLISAAVLGLGSVRLLAAHAVALQIGAAGVSAICTALFLRRYSALRPAAPKPAFTGLLLLARAGLPFLLANVALLLSSQVDTVVVGFIGRARDVALYRVGAQGAVLCTFAIQVLQNVASPYFAKLRKEGDNSALRKLFRTVQGIQFGVSAILVLVFAIEGADFIRILFGPAYVAAHGILIIISVGYLFNTACGPIGVLLSMTGHETAMSRIVWGTAIANVVVAIVLGRLAGPTGVAVATASSVAGYHILLRVYARRFFEL